MVGFLCLKWPLGPQGFSTLNFDTIVFGIEVGQPKGYVPDFFEKPPLVHRKEVQTKILRYVY